MKNEKRHCRRMGNLTDLLLLLINSIGIVGALVQVLQIPWAFADLSGSLSDAVTVNGGESGALAGSAKGMSAVGGLDRALFWGALFLICVSIILLRNRADKRRLYRRFGICIVCWIFLAAVFREQLLAGLSLALQNAVRNLNGRYLFHITLPMDGALATAIRSDDNLAVRLTTVSVLFLLYPPELVAGFLWNRGRTACLLLGNMLWLGAAFICDVFPDFFFLTFCVMGITGAVAQQEFAEMPGTGMLAAVWVLALTGGCVGIVRLFLLPVAEERYEAMREDREAFYRVVNEEWIPRLQGALSGAGFGFGGGPDVTGELNRRNLFSYTASDVYRVTVDRIPRGTLYLKGFVGGTYGEEAWEAWPDRQLERYYEEHGLEMPSDISALSNLCYMAAGGMFQNAETGYMGIRELGGRGSYSIYPYGALLTEDFKVYADGSVARRGKEYGFQYRFPEDFGGPGALPEEWRRVEENYRRYVYDSFLEYPREELPVLTERLEQEGFRRDSLYTCLLEVMSFLARQASYNLDAGRNPSDTDFVEYFLFESHEGYCVHFASAAVLTLRYLGIPARYVTGYAVSPSDFLSEDGSTYTAVLTGKQAHAWAEIYVDETGWIPVEMTPGAVALGEDNRLEQAALAGQLAGETIREPQDILQTEKERQPQEETQESRIPDSPEESLPSEEREQQPQEKENAASAKETESPDGGEGQAALSPNVAGTSRGTILKIVFAVLAAVALPFAALGIRRQGRKRWHRTVELAGTREEIFLRYRNLRKVLSAAGCSGRLRIDGNGFWDAFNRICTQITREEYETLCRILEKNSFSDREPAREELEELRRLYERIVREAYGKVPVYRKLFVGSLW